ncbi:uncharacterized protein LOC131436347 [Malaya genurostris]|uniref:uncharacterized protein LOC131436347 n=1 Tax=Malaya genurostris TaxID=325434 RepID=UPI0026F3E4D9|nr:uncharacterized protein LOC131436347 [Malaya genurostris]XP_058461000.1 uncharacterized protein LOC131436347 [Malaya genurostris]
MSSPADRRYPFDSPENKDGAPLYNSTDGFLPLGFSTPQHRSIVQNNTYSRNYYSAQPKYMLPRPRGHQNRGRHHKQSGGDAPPGNSSPGSEEGPSIGPQERKHHWQGNFSNYNKQYNQRRPRFGFGHHHQSKENRYDIKDYFHPSMLENPWEHLENKNQQDKIGKGNNFSDVEEGGGDDGSSGTGED